MEQIGRPVRIISISFPNGKTLIEKRDRLLEEHADEVFQETWLEREQWFVLRAKRPGVSARALAREYGLEELRDYIERSRREIDRMRGWPFADKLG